MDRTGIIMVTLCSILLGAWFIYEVKHPPLPAPAPVTNPAAATATPTATGTPATAANTTTTAAYTFNTNAPEQLLVITNADGRYTFTSRGGGIKSVELPGYPETVSARWKKEVTTNGVATLNTDAPLPVLALLGNENLIGDGNFTLTKTAHGVQAE